MDKNINLATICVVTNNATHSWHTGIGRGWPFNAEEETLFRSQLGAPSGKKYLTKRTETSTLLISLREGATVWQTRQFLPGWDMGAAAHIYDSIQANLERTQEIWEAFISKPKAAKINELVEHCGHLVPTPVGEIAYYLTGDVSVSLEEITARVSLYAKIADKEVEDLEDKITLSSEYSPVKAATYGASLYNPLEPCAFGDPYFLPKRVTQVTPARLQSILNYQKTHK